MLRIDEFDYDLPDESISQTPCEPRDAARLLDALAIDTGPIHRHVSDLPSLIRAGDVIVVNDTRVIPARLALQKTTGGAVEVMLLDPRDDGTWRALVRPSRRVKPGTTVLDMAGDEVLGVEDDLGGGVRAVRSVTSESVLEIAHRVGQVPLPPYITSGYADAERYQTVYARNEGSVAAPTAGLHFTPELMQQCREAGAKILRVELAVGLGTFRPILVDDINDHEMHAERFFVPAEVLKACLEAERVIAIGTTSVRALESAATFGTVQGSTELFISPGYEFKVVDVLLTNFHQPKSSLLVMLCAFAGPLWRDLYADALADNYRFLSFGDAMIVARSHEAH
ncbi:MAG: tRNA preQ1(34) S-adenosylmethionine ribosyltransferase-isomerase QueA [Acidimicrobiales bacterium]|jgi:S-adenosylmethionine:tRNA ribosyltransferase-isomerase